ncbi:MAG: carbohydrate kinase family protein [Desulfonatronovibrionaceae bacterium]
MSDRKSHEAVLFGEVLFDVFPDGAKVIGGAPFNVAWHLKGLGLNPLMLSRVSEDELGEKALEAMEARGLEISGIQIDSEHPTGRVDVEFKDKNEPVYTIQPGAAWDYIRVEDIHLASVRASHIFYHGSLAARNKVSEAALLDYLPEAKAVFCDLNLRPPWWSKENLFRLIRRVDHLKLNQNELTEISECRNSKVDLDRLARDLIRKTKAQDVVVTQGEEGAFLIKGFNEVHRVPASSPKEFKDSVGAGDAFSAVMIAALLLGAKTKKALAMAGDFAAEICRIKGAIPATDRIYSEFWEKWRV